MTTLEVLENKRQAKEALEAKLCLKRSKAR
jgi:hypothetical protein